MCGFRQCFRLPCFIIFMHQIEHQLSAKPRPILCKVNENALKQQNFTSYLHLILDSADSMRLLHADIKKVFYSFNSFFFSTFARVKQSWSRSLAE